MWAKDLLTALILLLVAGGYYAGSRGINQSALADEVGAAGLPIAYASALAALALALIVKTFVTWRFVGLTGVRAGSRASVRYEGRAEVRAEGRSGAGVGNEFRGEGARLLRAAGMLAIGVGYVAAVNFTGYALALVAVIAMVAVYQGERMDWRLAGIAVGGGALFFVFFDQVLGIDMPVGVWPSLAGS